MPKQVTILTPVYNEEASLPFYEQAVADILLSRQDYNFQVLFIDDGSVDSSWSIILDICARNPQFRGIRLSRNYGSHVALSAGFDNADGDAMATLASDLQDPPEVILEFLEEWRLGAQIVWGRRRTRRDEHWRILASKIFFGLVRRYAMPRGSKFTTGSFLLVDRKVAKCFRQFREHHRLTFAIVAWTGFEQAVVNYDRKQRMAGKSGWNFRQMVKSMYDTFISFSSLPIKLITWLGISTSLLCLPIAAYILFCWFTGNPLPGYTSLMMTMVFFFGIQFLLMGFMGEYLYRIYTEAMHRPLYFVSDTSDEHQPPRPMNGNVN